MSEKHFENLKFAHLMNAVGIMNTLEKPRLLFQYNSFHDVFHLNIKSWKHILNTDYGPDKVFQSLLRNKKNPSDK